MSDFRTPFEQDLHDLIKDALNLLRPGASRVKDFRLLFQSLMGRLRDMNVSLDNKKFGCCSGKHAGVCQCR